MAHLQMAHLEEISVLEVPETLAHAGEFGAIARWGSLLQPSAQAAPNVRLGLGDDCALLEALDAPAVTCDALIEGVHFKCEWTSARDLGWKTLAVSLSDLAAMGARPSAAFLSIAAPSSTSMEWLDKFFAGLGECAREFGCSVAGGDTTGSPGPLFLSLCAVGQLQVLGAPLLRAGALAGDVLIVSGTLGDSRAGLRLLQQEKRDTDASSRFVLDRHFCPTPRLREIKSVLEQAPGAISAALDLSDGLAGDAAHIARASEVSLHIERDRLPLSPALEEVARREKWDAREEALRGGEDYELLLCVRRADAARVLDAIAACGTRATIVGQVEEGQARVLVDGVDAPGSWTHF